MFTKRHETANLCAIALIGGVGVLADWPVMLTSMVFIALIVGAMMLRHDE